MGSKNECGHWWKFLKIKGNTNNGEKSGWLKQIWANLAKKLIIMVKNVAGWNKCGQLMKNMIPTNSVLTGKPPGLEEKSTLCKNNCEGSEYIV